MNIKVLDGITLSGYVTILIPALLLFSVYKSIGPAFRWYAFALTFHFVCGIGSEILYANHINPNYANSLSYMLGPIFYAPFFIHSTSSKRLKRVIFPVMWLHIVFSAVNLLFIQKETVNTYSGISYSAIVISLSLYFFYSLLKNLPSENLLSLPVFWIITAEFMVNTGQMLLKSFAHFLINIFNDNLIILWVFHHGLYVCGNLIILYGVWILFGKIALKSAKK